MDSLTQLLRPKERPASAVVVEIVADRWATVRAKTERFTARWDGDGQLSKGQTVAVSWTSAGPLISAKTRLDEVEPIDVEIPA